MKDIGQPWTNQTPKIKANVAMITTKQMVPNSNTNIASPLSPTLSDQLRKASHQQRLGTEPPLALPLETPRRVNMDLETLQEQASGSFHYNFKNMGSGHKMKSPANYQMKIEEGLHLHDSEYRHPKATLS